MAVNKVIFDGNTLIDLSSDTVAPYKLLRGETAHDKSGKQIVGVLTRNNIYSGFSEPTVDFGVDGDIYIQIE